MGLPSSLSPHLLPVPRSQAGPPHLSQGGRSGEQQTTVCFLFCFQEATCLNALRIYLFFFPPSFYLRSGELTYSGILVSGVDLVICPLNTTRSAPQYMSPPELSSVMLSSTGNAFPREIPQYRFSSQHLASVWYHGKNSELGGQGSGTDPGLT